MTYSFRKFSSDKEYIKYLEDLCKKQAKQIQRYKDKFKNLKIIVED